MQVSEERIFGANLLNPTALNVRKLQVDRSYFLAVPPKYISSPKLGSQHPPLHDGYTIATILQLLKTNYSQRSTSSSCGCLFIMPPPRLLKKVSPLHASEETQTVSEQT